MLSKEARSLVIYLLANWPDYIPITNRWIIHIMFLIDHYYGNHIIGLHWTKKYGSPWCDVLIKALQGLGCLHSIRRAILDKGEYLDTVMLSVHLQEAADKFLGEANSFTSLSDAYTLQGRSLRLIKDLKESV